MKLLTNRYETDELHGLALKVVDYNNEIVGTDEATAFHPLENGMFYINKEKADELLFVERKANGEQEVTKIKPSLIEALFKLYENVEDYIEIENK